MYNSVIKMSTRAVHVNNRIKSWSFKFLKDGSEWWPQRSLLFIWTDNILSFEHHVLFR